MHDEGMKSPSLRSLSPRLLLATSLLWTSGCSETDEAPGAPVPPVESTLQPACGPPGETTCYCPSGRKSGVQTCAADGTLSACTCLSVLPEEEPDVADSDLCPELQGLQGCTASRHVAERLPASVLFVVDRSGSMNCNLPPTQSSEACESDPVPVDPSQPTKWGTTANALKQVVSTLREKNSGASVGLAFLSTDGSCGADSVPSVNVRPLTQPQVASFEAALDAVQPDGQTPIVGGTVLAYAHLHQEAGQFTGCEEPCGAPGNRYVVLITDGADSCPDPTSGLDAEACSTAGGCTHLLLHTEAPQALEANIRTFVIGSPGSEPARGFLSELAWVGGTARDLACVHDVGANQGNCHFDMTTSPENFTADLERALGDISGAALACEFPVPDTGAEIVPSEVNVQYVAMGTETPVCLPKDETKPCDGGSNGWQFKRNPDGTSDLTRVVLCGTACDTVRQDPSSRVDVVRGCRSVILL